MAELLAAVDQGRGGAGVQRVAEPARHQRQGGVGRERGRVGRAGGQRQSECEQQQGGEQKPGQQQQGGQQKPGQQQQGGGQKPGQQTQQPGQGGQQGGQHQGGDRNR